MSKVCHNCGSDRTYLNEGKYELWNYDRKGNRLCHKCYNKLIANCRRIWFKDRQRLITYTRIGVCNLCRAVVPFDCKQTHMHHESYHDDDILRDTIELCVSCHRKVRGDILLHSS